jgi:Domain of unknown function (DUF4251)
MMYTKKVIIVLIAAISIFSACSSSKEGTGLTQAQVQELLTGRQYQFRATDVKPMSGKSRVLTETYTLNVGRDEINADLPYFGRAYTAPANPAEVGVRFSSRDFAYDQKDRSKDGWEITITPRDVSDIRDCRLIVYSNGNADLTVNSNSRQTISYRGYITSMPPKAVKRP